MVALFSVIIEELFIIEELVIIDDLKRKEYEKLLLVKVKSCIAAHTLSKEVSDILQEIFGPVVSKNKNVQKLRQAGDVHKLFFPLVEKNKIDRSSKGYKTNDDFVIVPSTEKVILNIVCLYH